MSDRPGGSPQRDPRSVAEMAVDVSERVSYLVREEIELAKAEITEKATSLIKGSVVGIAAGVFVFLGLAMLMHAIAWLLNDLFFGDTVWLGFLVEAVVWFVVAGIAGLIAFKAVKAGAPPTPDMAIEEGKEIREALQAGSDG
ncbi:MAG: phage holin family protein [Actinomycetota bacterium]|nr:phage holin family protein [Actinomycetota bacterium]